MTFSEGVALELGHGKFEANLPSTSTTNPDPQKNFHTGSPKSPYDIVL